MQRSIKIVFTLFLSLLTSFPVLADGGLVAFYKVAVLPGPLSDIEQKIENALVATKNAQGQSQTPFIIVGKYHPKKSTDKLVISFTRSDLINITSQMGDYAILASVLKVAVQKEIDENGNETGKFEVSLLNPEYMFYAYLRNNINSKNETQLTEISEDAKFALYNIPNAFFFPLVTSSLSENELKNYRFMVKYPGFEDMIELKKFNSLNQAVSITLKNLRARKNGTMHAYFLVPKDFDKLPGEKPGEISRILPAGSNIAVAGIGLVDQRIGESKFLPVLGEEHLAALPYEIIFSHNSAKMLNGRYRFPLFWSNIDMQQLRKIYKTPLDIEETFKSLMD